MGDGPARSALVLTASDGAAAGVRDDASGDVLEARLVELGFRDWVRADRWHRPDAA